MTASSEQPAIKDEEREHPIASAWRPTLRAIVSAFVRSDFALAAGIEGVIPIDAETARRTQTYIADYGETLVELSDETWRTSVAQWMGSWWEVLVDLWTEREGRSDLVLDARVYETDAGYRYEVHMVYVP